jgi:hypothetical protein
MTPLSYLPRGESDDLLLKPEEFDQLAKHPIAQLMEPLNVSRRLTLYSLRVDFSRHVCDFRPVLGDSEPTVIMGSSTSRWN